MRLLAIETSCDETALALVRSSGTGQNMQIKIEAEALYSQAKLHEQYGGVFPMLAKREHAKNLIPLFTALLGDAGLFKNANAAPIEREKIAAIFSREAGLAEHFIETIEKLSRPDIDAIAVTAGPGLEPALWVGINFAQALGLVWHIPVYAMNHMEGHIAAAMLKGEAEPNTFSINAADYPTVALLISGGHTQLVLSTSPGEYRIVGDTKDDAVGEAFDKAARIMGLPYPGGPEISKLADAARKESRTRRFILPRPMQKSGDLDFSFSGLKTAVLYAVKKHGDLDAAARSDLALEFENAVAEVLRSKTKAALEQFGARTLILGGGVSANSFLRRTLGTLKDECGLSAVLVPDARYSTDNALMIAVAAVLDIDAGKAKPASTIEADGTLALAEAAARP